MKGIGRLRNGHKRQTDALSMMKMVDGDERESGWRIEKGWWLQEENAQGDDLRQGSSLVPNPVNENRCVASCSSPPLHSFPQHCDHAWIDVIAITI